MFSRFFIHRPIFACVISIVIVLLGAVAYPNLPVAQYPDLAPPVVRVEALYPGADAETIAGTVAAPLEQEINGVDRMIYMQSTSSQGRYELNVSFETGADIDLAAVLVQNRVSVAEPKLPEEVRRLGVSTRKQSTAMVGVLAVFSPDGRYDDLFLANYMSIRMKDEVARIPGVGGVNVFPAKDYGMRVWLDMDKLKGRNLTVADVNNAIREQNVQVAAGALGKQPAPPGTNFEYALNVLGRLDDPEEFADIIVKRGDRGEIVRVRDIGRVELGARDYGLVSRFNGKPSAILVVYQLPGANLVDIANALGQKLEELKRDFPEGLEGEFFYDASMFIRASMHEVQKTLIEAFVLVFLVVLVFLQSMRTTLIPTLTIPVSLIGAFLFLWAVGFSVNMLTMFGLVLAIGIVVDDAIIVVENVERHLQLGAASAREATARAMAEITGPVVAVTLVLMSVFVPAAALPGITGEMYRQFALTIAASTFLSAVCALTLSPALCGVLLRPHDPHHKPFFALLPLVWLAAAFNAALGGVTSVYARLTRLTGRLAPLAALIFAGVVYVSYIAFTRVPTGFIPNEDLGFVVVAAQLPDAASLERSSELIERVAHLVGDVDGVQDVISLAGMSVLDGQGSSFANAWIVLEPWEHRYSHGRGIDAILADINSRVRSIQEAQFLTFSLPPISGVGNAAGFDMRVLDRASLGRAAIQQAVEEVLAAANSQSQILYAYSSFRAAMPQLFLDIDREKALRLDVPLSSIWETLQTALGSAYINDFNRFSRTFQVNVQADAAFRLTPNDIRRLDVRTRSGAMTPLGTLLAVRDDGGADRVVRYNLYEAAQVNGVPSPGTSSGAALQIMEQLAADKLPAGMGYDWTNLSYQERRVGNQALIVFALALVLVYLILAAQYESWTAPIAVVLSVPLAISGAVAMLTYMGLSNDVFTQIGLVLLVGLSAKNAILIVEFARENRSRGMGIVDSAVEAARTRLRPILMTSLSFILGVTPLLLATGAGAASRVTLGSAVFGGMISNTFLGLVFTPALYVAVQWLSELVGGRPRMHVEAKSAAPA